MGSRPRELLVDQGAYPGAWPTSVPERRIWTTPTVSGGGCGQAKLSDALSVALDLTGPAASDVFAVMFAPLGASVELHDAIALRYVNDAIGPLSGSAIRVNSGGNKHELDVRVVGERGQFHTDFERERVWLFRPDRIDRLFRPDRIDRLPEVSQGDGRCDCDGPPDYLVDLALDKRCDNPSPAESGARTVEVLEAAYPGARSGPIERVTSPPSLLMAEGVR